MHESGLFISDREKVTKARDFVLAVRRQRGDTTEQAQRWLAGFTELPGGSRLAVFTGTSGIYYALVHCAQNYHMMPNVIGKKLNGIGNLSSVLEGFDPHAVSAKYPHREVKRWLKTVETGLNPSNLAADSPSDSWRIFGAAVLDGAHWLSEFQTPDAFWKFVDEYMARPGGSQALPLHIASRIKGFGFALATNFLMDIGMQEFTKPDTHLKKLVDAGWATSSDDIQLAQFVEEMARSAGTTPYAVDRIFWLIGEGKLSGDVPRSLWPEFQRFLAGQPWELSKSGQTATPLDNITTPRELWSAGETLNKRESLPSPGEEPASPERELTWRILRACKQLQNPRLLSAEEKSRMLPLCRMWNSPDTNRNSFKKWVRDPSQHRPDRPFLKALSEWCGSTDDTELVLAALRVHEGTYQWLFQSRRHELWTIAHPISTIWD